MDNPISSTVADPRGFNVQKESNDETDLFGLLGRIVGLAGWADRITAAPLDDLIAGTKKEGSIEFYGSSSLTPQGAAEFWKL